jgi:hypothetical protein
MLGRGLNKGRDDQGGIKDEIKKQERENKRIWSKKEIKKGNK